MSRLLLDDYPILFLPKLAEMLGSSDRALLLQQIHYWIEKSGIEHDGRKWVFNSVATWHKQFSWISERTLRSILKYLEDEGILLTGNYNRLKFDRTKWYTIDYDRLDKLENAFGKSCQMEKENFSESNGKNLPKGNGNICRTNTRDYKEINKETKEKKKSAYAEGQAQPDHTFSDQVKEIVDYLNEKAGKHYKAKTDKTKRLIHARMKEGFTVSDFKKVIDNKLHDDWFVKKGFMRPETLFGTKFEGYLNETPKKSFKEIQEERYSKDFWGNKVPNDQTPPPIGSDDDVPF